jgi:hypothetical protein
MPKQKDTTLVWFQLSAPHTHGGKDCRPGDKIQLRPDQVERLAGMGKGEVVAAPKGGADVL